jgi:hypothetical protein
MTVPTEAESFLSSSTGSTPMSSVTVTVMPN